MADLTEAVELLREIWGGPFEPYVELEDIDDNALYEFEYGVCSATIERIDSRFDIEWEESTRPAVLPQRGTLVEIMEAEQILMNWLEARPGRRDPGIAKARVVARHNPDGHITVHITTPEKTETQEVRYEVFGREIEDYPWKRTYMAWATYRSKDPLLEPYEMHEAHKYVLDPVYSTSWPTRYAEEERDDGGDG